MPPDTPVIDLAEADSPEEISRAVGGLSYFELTSTPDSPPSPSSARRRRTGRTVSPRKSFPPHISSCLI